MSTDHGGPLGVPPRHRAVIRPLEERDLAAVAALNDAAVPAVSPLGTAGLRDHLARCHVAVVADTGAGAEAFLLALEPGAEYTSENYTWFAHHRPGSLYVDRLVVGERLRGTGVGRTLYRTARDHAVQRGIDEVTCEVNLDPPNPESLAFHGRLGFQQVGEQVTKDGSVRVALLAAWVDALR